MIDDTQFIEDVAMAEFMNRYITLLDDSAKLAPFEYRVIKTTYALVILDQGDAFSARETDKTIRSASVLLKNGGQANFELVLKPIICNLETTQNFLNRCWEACRNAENRATNDERIVAFLDYYKTLYEALAPRTTAASIAALVAMGRLPPEKFKLTVDGKADLRALRDLPEYLWAARKRLSLGLNSHIRNAYSHENYHLLDGGLVELWDVNPNTGRTVWGPERWNLSQLKVLCKELWLNSLAMYLAQLIFSTNNRPIIDAGNYYAKFRPTYPQRRISEIDSISRHLAEERSFAVIECTITLNVIAMVLATKDAPIAQDEEVFVGAVAQSRKYLRPVRNERIGVAEQAVGLLQRIENELDAPVDYVLHIRDNEGTELGQLRTNSGFIGNLPGKGKAAFAEMRKNLEIDTLGNAIMNVAMRYPLLPAT